MSTPKPNIQISTDASVIVNQWPLICRMIQEHGATRAQAREASDDEAPPVLSSATIENALEGPYQRFFQIKLQAYAKLLHIQIELHVDNDDVLKEARDPKMAAKGIPKHQIEKLTLDNVNTLRTQLNTLTEQHHEKWCDSVKHWATQLVQALTDQGLELSILEINDLYEQETLAELYDRFSDLNIALPKLKKDEISCSNYLKLKSDLAIHSALARQHKAHEQKDIDAHLKKIKKLLDNIQKEEAQLAKQQQFETNEVLQPISHI